MVPAVPRPNLQGPVQDLVYAIEDQLEDTYVIFQPTLARGPVLVHPEEGAFIFCVVPGLRQINGGWVDRAGEPADPAALAKAAETAFRQIAGDDIGAGCTGLVFIPDLPKSSALPPVVGGTTPVAIADSVLTAAAALKPPKPPGRSYVQAVFDVLAPGASEYVPDQVTDAQNAWRANRQEVGLAGADAGEPDAAILRMIERCVIESLQGRRPWLYGLPMRESELSSPRHLLAPLLVAAAEAWTPIVAAREGNGGFHCTLVRDEGALMYFRVTDIRPSAPLLLFLPFVHLLRKSCVKDQCILDGPVRTFQRWLIKHGKAVEGDDDIEIRIATSS